MKKQNWLLLCLCCFLAAMPARAQETNGKKNQDNSERRDFLEKHQEELKGLSPEERQAKIKELRKKEAAKRPNQSGLTLEERQAKRREVRERLQKQVDDLRKKKAEGNLTESDKKRLERMEELSRRFEEAQARDGLGSTNKINKQGQPLK